jgi:hypothetical protein
MGIHKEVARTPIIFFTLNRRGAPLLVFIENKSTIRKITKQGTIWDTKEPNKMGSRNKKRK